MKLINHIFHIITISFFILSAALLAACGKQETPESMKLAKAELSDREKALADLLAPVGSARLFDFTVDETIRQVTVTTYELKNGQWDRFTSNSTPLSGSQGLLFLGFENIPDGIRTGIQIDEENSVTQWKPLESAEESSAPSACVTRQLEQPADIFKINRRWDSMKRRNGRFKLSIYLLPLFLSVFLTACEVRDSYMNAEVVSADETSITVRPIKAGDSHAPKNVLEAETLILDLTGYDSVSIPEDLAPGDGIRVLFNPDSFKKGEVPEIGIVFQIYRLDEDGEVAISYEEISACPAHLERLFL